MVLPGFCDLLWGWYNTDACGWECVFCVGLGVWVWDLGFRFGLKVGLGVLDVLAVF